MPSCPRQCHTRWLGGGNTGGAACCDALDLQWLAVGVSTQIDSIVIYTMGSCTLIFITPGLLLSPPLLRSGKFFPRGQHYTTALYCVSTRLVLTCPCHQTTQPPSSSLSAHTSSAPCAALPSSLPHPGVSSPFPSNSFSPFPSPSRLWTRCPRTTPLRMSSARNSSWTLLPQACSAPCSRASSSNHPIAR